MGAEVAGSVLEPNWKMLGVLRIGACAWTEGKEIETPVGGPSAAAAGAAAAGESRFRADFSCLSFSACALREKTFQDFLVDA